MATPTCSPVEGSIQWAMDRGTLYQVNGVYKYGNLQTRAETPLEAAQNTLWRYDSYWVWVPSGTILTVWNVYAGSIGGFCMKDPVEYVVRRGEVCRVPRFQVGDIIALGDGFPAFQRGWKARIVTVYDHCSQFDGSPMYQVRFVHPDGGWLDVSENSVLAVLAAAAAVQEIA